MDIKHFFIEKGKGEPIILLHGNGENSKYFQGQIDVLSKQYHVYAAKIIGGIDDENSGIFRCSRKSESIKCST